MNLKSKIKIKLKSEKESKLPSQESSSWIGKDKIIKILNHLISYHEDNIKKTIGEEKKKHQFRSAQFKKAIITFRAYPNEILSGEQAHQLDGIGKGIADRVDEILKTGTLKELEEYGINVDDSSEIQRKLKKYKKYEAKDMDNLSVLNKDKLLIFDIEWYERHIHEIAWCILHKGKLIDEQHYYIQHNSIMKNMSTNECDIQNKFNKAIDDCDVIISHNLPTDLSLLIENKYLRESPIEDRGKYLFCSMYGTKNQVKTLDKNGKIKNPRLDELYKFLFGKGIEESESNRLHTANYDCKILAECILKLMSLHSE